MMLMLHDEWHQLDLVATHVLSTPTRLAETRSETSAVVGTDPGSFETSSPLLKLSHCLAAIPEWAATDPELTETSPNSAEPHPIVVEANPDSEGDDAC